MYSSAEHLLAWMGRLAARESDTEARMLRDLPRSRSPSPVNAREDDASSRSRLAAESPDELALTLEPARRATADDDPDDVPGLAEHHDPRYANHTTTSASNDDDLPTMEQYEDDRPSLPAADSGHTERPAAVSGPGRAGNRMWRHPPPAVAATGTYHSGGGGSIARTERDDVSCGAGSRDAPPVSGDRLVRRLRELLCCPVCNEQYGDARVLPACGHTFCAGCIERWCERSRDRGLECPLCRATSAMPDTVLDLPRNYALQEVAAILPDDAPQADDNAGQAADDTFHATDYTSQATAATAVVLHGDAVPGITVTAADAAAPDILWVNGRGMHLIKRAVIKVGSEVVHEYNSPFVDDSDEDNDSDVASQTTLSRHRCTASDACQATADTTREPCGVRIARWSAHGAYYCKR